MVAATAATSLDGVLNLQFATSAELVPAQDGKVLEYTVDKDGLDKLLNGYVATNCLFLASAHHFLDIIFLRFGIAAPLAAEIAAL